MSELRGLSFYKMSGSGNDFVVVDARREGRVELQDPEVIRRICSRGTGVGADGIVLLAAEPGADFRMVYFNADGSRASMCGNAALCCTRLFAQLTGRAAGEIAFETDSGRVAARLRDGVPEIDLAPVETVQPELRLAAVASADRMGYAVAGVPHATVLTGSVDQVDVIGRGRAIRTARELMPAGANANFVSGRKGSWDIRTYERGVEGETLACGTGAVASAILIVSWGLDESPVKLRTRSGRTLTVTLHRDGTRWLPSLAGEGRIVFQGQLAEI